jgi:hypothetical protein
MLDVAGVTVTELSVFGGAVTDKVALPLTPLIEAVMVAEPAASAEASPAGLIFAVAALEEVHAAELVTSAVELSL